MNVNKQLTRQRLFSADHLLELLFTGLISKGHLNNETSNVNVKTFFTDVIIAIPALN